MLDTSDYRSSWSFYRCVTSHQQFQNCVCLCGHPPSASSICHGYGVLNLISCHSFVELTYMIYKVRKINKQGHRLLAL